MAFTHPLALLFFGLFIPTILLYLLKQRRRRIEVPTLMFWDQILRDEQSVTSITKLKKLLSLLLQLLFIALLTLALARPMVSARLTGARRIVLMIDTSASMAVREGGTTRFELARGRALGVVRGMSMGDSLMAVAVAAEPDLLHPFTDSKRDLEEVIQKLEPTHAELNFKTAVRIIEELPPDPRETHVYIVSDGAFEPVEIIPPPRTFFAFEGVGETTDNVGITAFQVRPLPGSTTDFQIHLELTNQGKDEKTVPLELRIGGRLTDAYEVRIPPGASITRTLRQFSAQGGEVELILDAPDAFALDNHAFAALPAPKPIRVRLVTEANAFLEQALATDEEVELEVIAPANYVTESSSSITVFSGWSPPTTPPGNSIFISDWPDDLGLVKRGVVTKPLFTEWQRDHPINRHLNLQNVGIEKSTGIEPNPDFEKLALSFSDPLLLLRERARDRVLVITFDTARTDLPLRIAFPILIANAVRYLGGHETGERWQNPPLGSILGRADLDRFEPAASTNAPASRLLRVVDPRGRQFSADAAGGSVPINFAGFYRAEGDNRETNTLFAANLSSSIESNIKPAASLPLRAREPLPEIRRGFRLGFEPWIVLAFLALLLSTLEWALFHRRTIE